jgi:hypothetical protein
MNATNWTNAHMGEYHTWIALQPALAPADCRQEHEEDDDQTATRCVFWRERILVRLLRLGLRFDLDSLVVGLGQGGDRCRRMTTVTSSALRVGLSMYFTSSRIFHYIVYFTAISC